MQKIYDKIGAHFHSLQGISFNPDPAIQMVFRATNTRKKQ